MLLQTMLFWVITVETFIFVVIKFGGVLEKKDLLGGILHKWILK